MGTAAAVYLAKAGSQVALIDQFHFGHDRGSSHGESRIIRYSYADRRYVRLARAAYQLWHEMEAAVSARLITTAGGLDLGFAGSADFEGCIASLTAERVAFELIESCEIEARFAQLNVDSDTRGLIQAQTGILNPERCLEKMRALAGGMGVHFVCGEPVESIAALAGQVLVETTRHRYKARSAVIAAGAWAGDLLAALGVRIPVTVTQEQFAYFQPDNLDPFRLGRFPVFLCYGDGSLPLMYGFPDRRQFELPLGDIQHEYPKKWLGAERERRRPKIYAIWRCRGAAKAA